MTTKQEHGWKEKLTVEKQVMPRSWVSSEKQWIATKSSTAYRECSITSTSKHTKKKIMDRLS
jgi:hypothetical protein